MPPLGRAGAWRSRAVERMTTLLLLRLRFTLTTSGRTNRLLLAEEAAGLAFAGLEVTSNSPASRRSPCSSPRRPAIDSAQRHWRSH
jgi:hypothetical protein